MAQFEADIVWGAAVAIDRANGGYVKTDEWETTEEGEQVITKRPNKVLLKHMLAAGDYSRVTEEDIAEGQRLRTHFNGYLLKELAGKINDFEKSVLRIAQMNTLTHRSLLEFAIISCLPNSYRREMRYRAHEKEVIESTPLEGNIGDTVQGDLIIVKSYFNQNYSRYRITGRFGESFVDFWYKDELKCDETYKIRGKIKQHRPDNTTQLHYVKKLSE